MWTTSKTLVAGAVLAVASFSAAANAQTYYAGPDRNIERGTEAMMQGDLETASKFFHRAADSNLSKGRLVPLLNNLCAVDYALGKLDSAQEACTRAIAEDRRFWRAYVNRGNVLKAKGDYSDAHRDYAKAVSLKPKSGIAQRALARLQEEQPKLFAAAQ